MESISSSGERTETERSPSPGIINLSRGLSECLDLPPGELARQVRYFWGLDLLGEKSSVGLDGVRGTDSETPSTSIENSDSSSDGGSGLRNSSSGERDQEMGFGEPRKLQRTQAIQASIRERRATENNRRDGSSDSSIERKFYVDPDSGARKEIKEARFDLIPPDVLFLLAKHYGYGARKYGERNMEGGYPYSVSYAALQRHLNDWYQGIDHDQDPDGAGSHHLIAAIWHCITLLWFQLHERGNDDRPKN